MSDAAEQNQRRQDVAVELAFKKYGSDSVEIYGKEALLTGHDPHVLSVDAGYWVEAAVFVDADEVEGKLKETPRLRVIREWFESYGEGRQEDMSLDLDNPDRFLLIQSSPSDNEPWYVLLDSPERAAQYIRQDYPQWDFETLVDLDTGEEYSLKTQYVFERVGKEEESDGETTS